ncbi:MAG: lysine--tRNA ligase [Elusimicrobiota bacterium]|jgi:lysyl-tRNA synthetase class 2|nr:lysine--tRNA ligase [Elusimicrobiota bacterium]
MQENNQEQNQVKLSALEDIIKNKYQEAADLKAQGINPYPAHVEVKNTCLEVKNAPVDTQVITAGRLVQLRLMGKAAFAHIKDFTGKMQIYVQRDLLGEDKYTFFKKHIAVGDFVRVSGHIFLTKTGEKTIKADSVELISKAIRPLPEKFHGLQDTEVRFRNRHLDLIANEDVKEIFIKRAKIISSIRKTLDEKGYLEVETPTLTPSAGGAIAKPFETFHNALKMPLFMRIALELYHKRLIIGGLDKIYEIGKMFRNEGIDTTHNPEFTMMELYQAYGDVYTMADLFEEILGNAASAIGAGKVMYRGREINLKPPYKRISIPVIWQETFGQDIHEVLDGREFKKEPLLALAKKAGVAVKESEPANKIFDALFDERIVNKFDDPVLMMDYPTAVSPFSKTKPGDPAIVERFEAFVAGGQEIANAYSEINDPADQYQRLKDQAAQKAQDAGNEDADIVDMDYIVAMESGMPPTGGMGIGIDRINMMLTGQDSIREIILFPTLKNLDKQTENN